MSQSPQEIVELLLATLEITPLSLTVNDQSDSITCQLEVSEHDSGVLIGFRGEKINALQLMLTLMFNNQAIAYRPVHIDINGYRQRRTDALLEMADAAAANAVESGREIILPLMPSFERRQIHLRLESNTEVETYSEGEGISRRLVIRPVSLQS